MKFLSISLVAMLALIQYPLWLGKGGWLRVWELDRQLVKQQSANQVLASRNSSLEAEVRDLQEGRQAVEERARYELGMIRKNEIFIQINEPPSVRPAGLGAATPVKPAN
jgi:cell division protein FtsB